MAYVLLASLKKKNRRGQCLGGLSISLQSSATERQTAVSSSMIALLSHYDRSREYYSRKKASEDASFIER